MAKEISPRLKKLAELTKSEELIARDIEKAQEDERQREEEIKKIKGREQHLKNLETLQEGELETAIYAFVNHPDFSIIYNQANIIENTSDRWAFVLRRAYEVGEDVNVPIGYAFQSNDIKSKKMLEEYGIYILCPYFKSDESALTKELCLIDKEPTLAACRGQHQFRNGLCKVFEDRSVKAASGLIQLPKIEKQALKLQISKIEVEPVDIYDLDDWWQKEGKYR